jgi:hypothetical protein
VARREENWVRPAGACLRMQTRSPLHRTQRCVEAVRQRADPLVQRIRAHRRESAIRQKPRTEQSAASVAVAIVRRPPHYAHDDNRVKLHRCTKRAPFVSAPREAQPARWCSAATRRVGDRSTPARPPDMHRHPARASLRTEPHRRPSVPSRTPERAPQKAAWQPLTALSTRSGAQLAAHTNAAARSSSPSARTEPSDARSR